MALVFGIKHSFKLHPSTMDYIREYLPEYSFAHNEQASIFQQLMMPFGRELDDLYEQVYAFKASLDLFQTDSKEQAWMYTHHLRALEGESFHQDFGTGSIVTPLMSATQVLSDTGGAGGTVVEEIEEISVVDSYRDFVIKASPTRVTASETITLGNPKQIVAPTPLLEVSRIQKILLREPSQLIVTVVESDSASHNLIEIDPESDKILETEILIKGLDRQLNKVSEKVSLLNILPHRTRQEFIQVDSIRLVQAPQGCSDSITIRTIPEKGSPAFDGSRHVRRFQDVFTNPLIYIDPSHGSGFWPNLTSYISNESLEMDLLTKQLPSLPYESEILVLMPEDPNEPNSAQYPPSWIDFAAPALDSHFGGLGVRHAQNGAASFVVAYWPKRQAYPTVFDDGTRVLTEVAGSTETPEVNFFAIPGTIEFEVTGNDPENVDDHTLTLPLSVELDTPRGLYYIKSWSWTLRYPNGQVSYIDESGVVIPYKKVIKSAVEIRENGLQQHDMTVAIPFDWSDLINWRDPDNRMLVRSHCIIELEYTRDDGVTERVKKLFRIPVKSAEYTHSRWEHNIRQLNINPSSDLNLRLLHNLGGSGRYSIVWDHNKAHEFPAPGSTFFGYVPEMKGFELVERYDIAMLDTVQSSIIFREDYSTVDIDYTGGF